MAIGGNTIPCFPPRWASKSTTFVEDDFTSGYTTASTGPGSTLAGSSGSTVSDDTTGTDNVLITTAASSGDYQGWVTSKALFMPQQYQGIRVGCRFRYTNQSTNNGAVFFGVFSSTPATSAPTSVPTTSYSGAILYKLNGDTVWRVQSSNGTTKLDIAKTNEACTDGTYELEIMFSGKTATSCQVTYFVNGRQVSDTTQTPNKLISHELSYSGLVKAKLGFYVMAGSNNAQTAYLDLIAGAKSRIT